MKPSYDFFSSLWSALSFIPEFVWQKVNGLPKELSGYRRASRYPMLVYRHFRTGNQIFLRASYCRNLQEREKRFFRLPEGHSVLPGDLVNKYRS
jgi:hypothetical protein